MGLDSIGNTQKIGYNQPMNTFFPFIKMHGAGNDFVIFDARKHPIPFTPEAVARVADRHFGVGCDQLIVIKPSSNADAFMVIYNADGSESGTCGNATRCVASLLTEQLKKNTVTLETVAGLLQAEATGNGQVTVDMGVARLGWQDIPLAKELNTLHLGIGREVLQDPVGVSMGNPHAVFFVPNVDNVDLARLGPLLEHDPLFPAKANIGVAQILSRSEIKLRVWERGSGETLACGSGACAAGVAANRRNLTDNKVAVHLPGGTLQIEWKEDGRVLMTGPVATSFTGVVDASLLR